MPMKFTVGAIVGTAAFAIGVAAYFWADDENYTKLPWSIDFRLCRTVVSAPSASLAVISQNSFPLDGVDPRRDAITFDPVMLLVRSRGPETFSAWTLALEPTTGHISDESPNASDVEAFKDILPSKRVAKIDPNSLPWPYNDTYQPSEIGGARAGPQLIQYKRPDPASGIGSFQWAIADDFGSYTQYLGFSNCRSQMIVLNQIGPEGINREVLKDVLAEDEAAFERLLATVEYMDSIPP